MWTKTWKIFQVKFSNYLHTWNDLIKINSQEDVENAVKYQHHKSDN